VSACRARGEQPLRLPDARVDGARLCCVRRPTGDGKGCCCGRRVGVFDSSLRMNLRTSRFRSGSRSPLELDGTIRAGASAGGGILSDSMLCHLDTDEVLRIHDRVCRDFAASDDPVDTPGVRDHGLLESAVARQHTGYGLWLKYDTVWSNAATLTFGLCCNHAFHNGNKRTALVCMIAHLEKNRHALFDTKHDQLYTMIKDVAKHTLGDRTSSRGKPKPPAPRDADKEVAEIARWLRKRARRVDRKDRQITGRQLRTIIAQHGYELRDAKNNSIVVCKRVERRKGLSLRKITTYDRVCNIAFRGDTQPVALNDVRLVRKLCELDEEHGYDAHAFYKSADPVDVWINDYRGVLARLSKE
jgi:death on curing protein